MVLKLRVLLLVVAGAFSVNSITIKSPSNSSLCIRTKAHEWEGAMMTLLDCDRTYQFYDGAKNHFLGTFAGFEGVKLETTWAPAETSFGISGCFVPLDGKIRAVSCYENTPSEFWNVTELDSNNSIHQMQNIVSGKCIGVPKVDDNVALEEVSCDVTDPLQQWKFIQQD